MGTLVDRVFEYGIQAQRVDFAEGVVYGAKIAGMKSLHGRDYTDDVYRAHSHQYEGMIGYRNHAGGQSGRKRDVDDVFCVYHNPVVVPGEGVHADIHVLDPEEPFARKFLKAAASDDPAKHKAFSFSHDASIRTRDGKGGRKAVESIDKVLSVDVVARGATTKGIFEGYDMIPPVGTDEEGEDDKPYHHHVGNALKAIATHPTMHPEAKKTKTGHLMRALHGTGMDEPMEGKPLGDKGDDTDPELSEKDGGKKKRPAEGGEIEPESGSKGGSFKEGADDMTELERLRLEKRIRTTADKLGVAVDDSFLAECVQEGFDDAVLKLADRQKRQRDRDAARPKSVAYGGRAQESSDDAPRTTQDFLARIAPGTQGRVAR